MFKTAGDQSDIQNEDPNKENIHDSGIEKRSKGRPLSAKGRTPKNRYRPNSANRAMSGKRRGLFKPKDVNPILLSRIKPKRFVINRMGKEKLYENNLALQMQFNKVKETNLRLKTKIHRLNKDLERHEDIIEDLRNGQGARNAPQIRNFHLVGNLKTKIAELNLQVKRKDEELALIKRSTRATKLLELEVQMQSYIDECTRLKHHLEEILKEKDYFPADYGNADVAQHAAIINNLRRENQDLHAALQASREDVEKWRTKAMEKQSKSIKAKKGKPAEPDGKFEQEVMKQKQLIKRLQEQLETAQNSAKEKDGMISLLQAKVIQLEKSNDPIVVKSEEYKFVPEPPSMTKPAEQPRAKQFAEKKLEQSFSFEEADMDRLSSESQPNKRKVPAPIITDTPSVASEDSDRIPKIRTDDVQEILKHVSLRMQLHRLQKKEVGETLFGKGYDEGKKYTIDAMSRIFKEQPFEFTDPMENALIARFLIEKSQSDEYTNEQEISGLQASAKEITKKLLKELPDWEIFNPHDEKNFDKEIAMGISSNLETFESACKVYDSNMSGVISLEHFESVTRKLGIQFSELCTKYMHLLFYSHSFELGRVPYQQFIDAYGNVDPTEMEDDEFSEEDEEEDDLSEEERAAIVRQCLKVIAEALKGQKPADVFSAEGPNLYPGEFLEGLRSIGVPDFDKQVFIIFIESLQSEEEEEQLCIDFEYFENLLDHYAEAEASFDNESKIMMETGEEDEERQVQRSVSILDSPRNELDYSDEDKQKRDQPKSQQLSEGSPFKTRKKKGNSSSGNTSSIKSESSSGPGSVIEHSDESYEEEFFDEDDVDSDFEMSADDSPPMRVHSR